MKLAIFNWYWKYFGGRKLVIWIWRLIGSKMAAIWTNQIITKWNWNMAQGLCMQKRESRWITGVILQVECNRNLRGPKEVGKQRRRRRRHRRRRRRKSPLALSLAFLYWFIDLFRCFFTSFSSCHHRHPIWLIVCQIGREIGREIGDEIGENWLSLPLSFEIHSSVDWYFYSFPLTFSLDQIWLPILGFG